MKDQNKFTNKHKKYFSEPRDMQAIADDLFNGDYWAANTFQNELIAQKKLRILPGTPFFVNFDYKP